MLAVSSFLRAALLVTLLALSGLWSAPVQADSKVWVNTTSGVYHCPGGRYYGNTKHGEYLSERSAVSHGYRPAYGATCSPQEASAAKQSVRQSLVPSATGAGIKVWINTKSHVYHCPGSQYYGGTKSGRYASEAEAAATGNRPAYGTRCG